MSDFSICLVKMPLKDELQTLLLDLLLQLLPAFLVYFSPMPTKNVFNIFAALKGSV